MYRYTILAVGKMKNSALASLCADYVKRLGRQGSCEIIELKDGTIAREGQRILDALQKRQEGIIYLLSEEGQERSSLAFAKELKNKSAIKMLISGVIILKTQLHFAF